jgi:murein L,D-transpeptidase YafK
LRLLFPSFRLFALSPVCLALSVCGACPASAAWDAVITGQLTHPSYFVAVDKTRQKLAFFEKRSPLRLSGVFVCTTGQKEGDKEVEGDLKTPEGVYFVVRRIDGGLDFTKYGPCAYTLNYPNPVDRMRGKTGFGIWIHGRGEPLVPLQTEGCVAMNNNDLSVLGKALLPGVPVALTRSFVFGAPPAGEDGDLSRLERKVRDWADAWSGRSRRFFDFYNSEAYSAAQGEHFSAFRARKERLFALLPWIRTTVRDIKILPGPDYWVTWFHQDYQAPNLSTRGTRRLYWEKNGTDFRIVGMEWEPGLDDSVLTASAGSILPLSDRDDPLTLLDAAWRPPGDAVRVAPASDASHAAYDAGVPASVPSDVPATPPAVFADFPAEKPAEPSAGAEFRAPSPAATGAPSTPDHIEDPAFGPMPRPSGAAFRLAALRIAEKARAEREKNTPQRPAEAVPVVPPARVSGAVGEENRPASVPDVAAASERPGATRGPAAFPDPAEGEPAQNRTDGIAASSAAETRVARDDALLGPAGEIADRIEAWRVAWERGDIAAYAGFYAPGAVQGDRGSAAGIRRHKAGLWRRNAPAMVRLTDIRVRLSNGGPVADMNQEYAGRAGGRDRGIKTLTFGKINGAWMITREEWREIEAGH